jgi:hypothetical protein
MWFDGASPESNRSGAVARRPSPEVAGEGEGDVASSGELSLESGRRQGSGTMALKGGGG